ncbi:hypothetical protein CR513_00545, partial [Mucuna pruriens]
MFLEKFFPTLRTTSIRKEICGIKKTSGKTLYEYWARFNKLRATCYHHKISEQLLIQYFYEGLMLMDKSMIDVASGVIQFGVMGHARYKVVNVLVIGQHHIGPPAKVCVAKVVSGHQYDGQQYRQLHDQYSNLSYVEFLGGFGQVDGYE